MTASLSANMTSHHRFLDAPGAYNLHPSHAHHAITSSSMDARMHPIDARFMYRSHEPPIPGPSRLNDSWRKRRQPPSEEEYNNQLNYPSDPSPNHNVRRRISIRFRFNPNSDERGPSSCLSSSCSVSPYFDSNVASAASDDSTPLNVTKPSSLAGGGRPRRQHIANTPRRSGRSSIASASQTPRSTRSTRSRRQSGTPTTLESIRAEAIAIRTEITRLGLRLRDVTADGNCLFRALADQLWGDQARHAEVRKLVCDYLENHPDDVSAFVAGFLNEGEDYDGYVKRMRTLGVYGGHVELLAAAKIFHRSIRIILSNTSYTVEWESEVPPPLQVNRRTRSNTISTGQPPDASQQSLPYIPPTRTGRTMLWLALFSDAEHYESIRSRGDREIGPAEIEDERAVPHAMDLSEMARRARGEGKEKNQDRLPSLDKVLASLPPGHGISTEDARNVLERVKGDLGEAVEILLEMMSFNSNISGGDEDDSSDHHVETMLASTTPVSTTSTSPSLSQHAYREPPSPVDTDSSRGSSCHSHSTSRSIGTTSPTSAESESRKEIGESVVTRSAASQYFRVRCGGDERGVDRGKGREKAGKRRGRTGGQSRL